jgi:hypothetical protein
MTVTTTPLPIVDRGMGVDRDGVGSDKGPDHLT